MWSVLCSHCRLPSLASGQLGTGQSPCSPSPAKLPSLARLLCCTLRVCRHFLFALTIPSGRLQGRNWDALSSFRGVPIALCMLRTRLGLIGAHFRPFIHLVFHFHSLASLLLPQQWLLVVSSHALGTGLLLLSKLHQVKLLEPLRMGLGEGEVPNRSAPPPLSNCEASGFQGHHRAGKRGWDLR